MRDGVNEILEGVTILLLFGIPLLFVLAYNGTFYTTGLTWYEECWKFTTKKKHSVGASPAAPDAYTDLVWKSCPVIAAKGAYSEGLIFVRVPKSEQSKDNIALARACPNNRLDVPSGGLHYLGVKLIQESGGPRKIDMFLPASWTVGRFFRQRWPECNEERKRQGFPRIVETSRGKFDWETPCVSCDQRAVHWPAGP
jgi:hypothetical protein